MHKGIILLVKADSRKLAEKKIKEFMDQYENQVWDWWTIGGRWTGTLDKYEPHKDRANYEKCDLCNGTGLRNDRIGQDARAKDPSYTCNACGHYNSETKKYEYEHGHSRPGLKLKFTYNRHANDIMALSECLDVVKEWHQDPEQEYVLGIAAKHLKEDFHFDVNVYNTETLDYSIPEDVAGWFAVMVDIHN